MKDEIAPELEPLAEVEVAPTPQKRGWPRAWRLLALPPLFALALLVLPRLEDLYPRQPAATLQDLISAAAARSRQPGSLAARALAAASKLPAPRFTAESQIQTILDKKKERTNRRWDEATCGVSASIAAEKLVLSGLQIESSIYHCAPDKPTRTACATDITGVFASISAAGSYLAAVSHACPKDGTSKAECASDILDILYGVARCGNWTVLAPSASWSPRGRAGSAVLRAEGFILGGYDGKRHLNDVWSSADGKTWRQLTAHAAWEARSGHVAIALKGRLLVMAGENSPIGESVFFNDVWASQDGAAWVQVTEHAPWCERTSPAVAASDSKVYILGGVDAAQKFLNDVWSSEDGKTWQQLTAAAPWDGRWGFGAALHGGRLVVLGGSIDHGAGEIADVWNSPDGATWEKISSGSGRSQWQARSNFGLAVWRDKLLLAGGRSYEEFSDVWTSSDGTNWTQLAVSSPWIPRDSLCLLSFDSQSAWLFGGSGRHVQDYYNDVWELHEASHEPGMLLV
ncbi:ivns1abp [Symbiodinium sp. CCMP2592]|nr:ivns1abp [Symbiodinium sp. CCMP2592]